MLGSGYGTGGEPHGTGGEPHFAKQIAKHVKIINIGNIITMIYKVL